MHGNIDPVRPIGGIILRKIMGHGVRRPVSDYVVSVFLAKVGAAYTRQVQSESFSELVIALRLK